MEGESKKKEPLVVVDSKAEIIGKLSRSVDPFTKDYYKLACRILLPRNVDNDNDFSKLYEMAENSLGEEECIRFTCSIFREAGYNNHGLTEFAEKTLGYNVREYNVRKVYPRVDLILTTYNFICNLDPNDPRNDFQSFQSFVCLKTGVDRNGYNTPFLLVKLCFDEGIIPEDGNISEMLKLSEIYNRGYYFKHYCTRQGFTKEGLSMNKSNSKETKNKPTIGTDSCITNSSMATVGMNGNCTESSTGVTSITDSVAELTTTDEVEADTSDTIPYLSSPSQQIDRDGGQLATGDQDGNSEVTYITPVLYKEPDTKDILSICTHTDTDHSPVDTDRLAQLLELDLSTRKGVEKSSGNRLEEVVEYWKQQQPTDVTWMMFRTALETMKRIDLAKEVNEFLEKHFVKYSKRKIYVRY